MATPSSTAIKRTKDRQTKAFAALVRFVRECEITGVQTDREREQREAKLVKLVLKIEEAAQEALYADLLNDIEKGKRPRSRKLKSRR